jgi:uncharacterized protein (TIGR02421 family)
MSDDDTDFEAATAPAPAELDLDLVAIVSQRLAAGKPVRRTLVGGGRLHVDRPLPFLCVYRAPHGRVDLGTAELVRTQASYLIAPADPERAEDVNRLIAGVVESLATVCGACLVLELWSSDDAVSPVFRIHTANQDRLAITIDALAEALRAMTLPVTKLAVEVISAANAAPPGLQPLIAPELAAREGVLSIGLEVPPLYRSAQGVYPLVLRALSRDLMHALQLAFFEFTRVQTPARPEHFQMLGRRRVVRAVRESDQALADIDASFDFLLAVTPVNTDAAWDEFCASGRTTTPRLHYRMLTVDPELGKRRLYDLPLDKLEDPVLAQLLRDKRRELDRQLSLLEDRDTPRFLHGSLQLYEPVDDALLAEALAILAAVAPSSRGTGSARCDADALALRARQEVEHYRGQYSAIATAIHIRDDVSSLLVSSGDLLIPRRLDVAATRVEALLQHEVGTHVVTYVNGKAQPLQVLAAGLAGYEALQEGLAMLAEHLAGGLDGDRLRLVAARVVAVRRLVEGVAFPALFEELVAQHRLSPRSAFGVAVRVFRGGGLTKDAIYLRGLMQVLAHLRAGHDVMPLLVGKLAFEQVALVEELLRREILRPPVLQPRWLAGADASARLARARAGLRPIDLIEQ